MRTIWAILQSAKKNVCEIDLCENGVQNEFPAWDFLESCCTGGQNECEIYASIWDFACPNAWNQFCDNRVHGVGFICV